MLTEGQLPDRLFQGLPFQGPRAAPDCLADYYYSWLHAHILSRQSPALGLFPRSNFAYVTDNVYCAATVWALSKVFARINDGTGRRIELEQTAIKTMRAILFCYTKQVDKLEQFKYRQDPKYCLHTKFDPHTGDEIHTPFKHMQLRSVSLYLFYLSQMIRAGLVLIYTLEECHIVQNLVYYIDRSYRINDYGMWGLGRKDSPDSPELSASSIAITVAALEECEGLNLFGETCYSSESVIFVDPDAVYRNKEILRSLLPRESRSRDVDAALIMTKGYPAFAVKSAALCGEIEEKLDSELLGEHGYRRFTGDRLGRVDEDVAGARGSECEWPFILLFQTITCSFNKTPRLLAKYRALLDRTLYESEGYPTVPQYYSQGVPVTGGVACVSQALLILTGLLESGLVLPRDIDRRVGRDDAASTRLPVVQVALLAESVSFQSQLSTYSITTQTPSQIESVYIWPSSKLVDLLYHHGSDVGLGLTGRPRRPLGSLCTSRVWKIAGKTVMCIPLYQDKQDFYISTDERFVAKAIKTHLQFLTKHWREAERPTFCILLTSTLFKQNSRSLVRLLNILRAGQYKDTVVKIGRLQELITVAKSVEIVVNSSVNIDFQSNRILASPILSRRSLSRKSIASSSVSSGDSESGTSDPLSATELGERVVQNSYLDIYTRVKGLGETDLLQETLLEPPGASNVIALIEMGSRHGRECIVNGELVTELIDHHYKLRTLDKDWLAVRCCAAYLNKTVDSLAPALSAVIVSGRALCIGTHGTNELMIDGPLHPSLLHELIHQQVESLLHVSLQQELLIYTAELLVELPLLFSGITLVRLGAIISLLESTSLSRGELLESYPPHKVQKELRELLVNSDKFRVSRDWRQHRVVYGTLGRVPNNFYQRVFDVLSHRDITIKARDKAQPSSSKICYLSGDQMTCQYNVSLSSRDVTFLKPSDPMFALRVEMFLNQFTPEYRYLVIELLVVISHIIQKNPEVSILPLFPVLDFIDGSGVAVEEAEEEVARKLISCLVSRDYVSLDSVSNCIMS